ncbi:MAG: alpha/beta hydrolase [Candidatus Sumerlaeota bacterium]|nr:alpha/beta hydrolase [Candidatus Sumerlaeota bacterium]
MLVLPCFVALTLYAQEGAQIPLATPTQDAKTGVAKTTQGGRAPRPYTRKPDLENIVYGPYKENVLDLWKAKSDHSTPLVTFFHPGGYMVGDKSWIPPPLLETCLRNGISVATANYRFASEAPLPASMLDGARAIQFLRLHANEWDFNPNAFAATGSSAGAAMSLWIGFHEDMADPKSDDPVQRQSTRLCAVGSSNGQPTLDPRAIVKMIGQDLPKSDAEQLARLYGLPKDADLLKAEQAYPLFEAASPMTYLKPGAPPVHMYYAFAMGPFSDATPKDERVHNIRFGVLLKEQMDKLGIECILHSVEDYPGSSSERPAKYNQDLIDFFLRHFPHDAK